MPGKLCATYPCWEGELVHQTHPNSQWIWADHVLNSDEVIQRTICVIAKDNPTETTQMLGGLGLRGGRAL